MNGLTKRERAIAGRVRSARESAGISQKECGDALGLSDVGYGHYDRGTQPFTVEQLFLLAPVLGVSVAWLLGLDTGLSPEEDQLVALYRAADPALQAKILGAVKAFIREG